MQRKFCTLKLYNSLARWNIYSTDCKYQKIPGRDLLRKMKIPNYIKQITILGNISERSKLYMKKNSKKIVHIQLPYANVSEIIKRISLDKNSLTFITLPTPKQEQLAIELSKKNKNFKIICIGAQSLLRVEKRNRYQGLCKIMNLYGDLKMIFLEE